MEVVINYWAVLGVAVASMVLGSLWYGPLFGKTWMKLAGVSMSGGKEGQKAMMKSYALMFVSALIMGFVLAHFLKFAGTFMNDVSLSGALMGAAWIWLGFVAPPTVGMVLWEGKPWKYWLIVSGYWLADLLIAAVILTLF